MKNKIIDFFFPKYCLACFQVGSWLCFKCYRKIKERENTCFICQKKDKEGKICSLCLYRQGEKEKTWHLNSLIWAGDYKNKVLKNLIIALKIAGVKEIAQILADLVYKKIRQTWPKQEAILIPIPISKKRKNERGYNQALLIAQTISSYSSSLILKDELKIIKIGQKQTKKKIEKRWLKNHQFIWTGEKLNNKNIIIIDDVVTSGATLNQAALALKITGAKNIKGATVLKA